MIQGGEILNQTYEIIKEIGSGGLGIVYLAYHLRLEKYVVIKKIKDNFVNLKNVRTEVDILKGLHHMYLPQVYDFVQIDTQVYTVMDYIDGYDLGVYLEKGYTFDEETLCRWFRQLCEVLDYLHNQKPKIIHSDIKPENIMIDTQGNVCLIDFNISLNTEDMSKILGFSRYYASPEQVKKASTYKMYEECGNIVLDERTDIYSLGATFYRLMTGIRPTTDLSEFVEITHMDLPYSEGFVKIIGKTMQENVECRYQTTKKILHDLNNLRKLSAEYRRTQIIKISVWFLVLILVTLGSWGVYHNISSSRLETYTNAYQNLIECYETQENKEIISKGIKFLNNKSYAKFLEKNKEDKAAILHTIAEVFVEENEYIQAESYYIEALDVVENMEIKEVYNRDYAICLAKQQKFQEAQIQLKQSSTDENQTLLVEAEIAFAKEDYTRTIEVAKQILNTQIDTELKIKVLSIAIDAFERQGRYQQAIRHLIEVEALSRQVRFPKQLGRVYLLAAEQEANTYNKNQQYQQAMKVYERLEESGSLSFEDSMNYAVANEALQHYQRSKEILLGLLPHTDYRVYMRLGLVSYAVQNMADTKKYYKQAKELYEKQSRESGEDENMKHLEEIVNSI